MVNVFETFQTPIIDEDLIDVLCPPIMDEKLEEIYNFSSLGIAVTVLGLILVGAPTSGRVTQSIGFFQTLIGAIIFTLSQ